MNRSIIKIICSVALLLLVPLILVNSAPISREPNSNQERVEPNTSQPVREEASSSGASNADIRDLIDQFTVESTTTDSVNSVPLDGSKSSSSNDNSRGSTDSKGEIKDNSEECPICYAPLNHDVDTTSCGHKFHSYCLTQWTENTIISQFQISSHQHGQTFTCPMCRKLLERAEIVRPTYDPISISDIFQDANIHENCPVCNANLDNGVPTTSTECCSHTFHMSCYNRYRNDNLRFITPSYISAPCPICNATLPGGSWIPWDPNRDT